MQSDADGADCGDGLCTMGRKGEGRVDGGALGEDFGDAKEPRYSEKRTACVRLPGMDR